MTTRDPARPCVGEAVGVTSAEALGIAASRLIVRAGRRVQYERRPAVARYQVAADVLQICSTATGFEIAIREVIAELPEPVRPGQPREAAVFARQRWEQQFTEAVTGRLI